MVKSVCFLAVQDDFVLGKKLGEGAFGVVYRVSLAKKPNSKVWRV